MMFPEFFIVSGISPQAACAAPQPAEKAIRAWVKTLTIGKELEIRRTLSSSHLFSSAFVIDKGELKNGVPEWFLLTGAGWGHGVGLCQIGAAVMGERGYTYDEILLHYYKGADIRRFY